MLRWPISLSLLILSTSFVGCEHMKNLFQKKNAVVDVDQKRPGDSRTYRAVTLDNKLTAFLISDPKLNKSSAAMDVSVGSIDDPEDHQGLSHFLEHMLFLGTKKYPEVDEYSQYLAKYQGYSNAYTAEEDTNYFFEVDHEGFDGAVDRFAQFFIDPLFTPEYVDRELHAVHSEHDKNIQSDSWRGHRVFELMHKAGHPRRKFGTGNLETLGKVDRKTLLAHYKNHYSANRMKLALMTPFSLDEMEKIVREKFVAIPNYDLKKPTYDPEIFTAEQTPRLVNIQPVKDLKRLEFSFASPSEHLYWKSKPSAMISHILGYEGEGSLLSFLKKEGLATKLGAGFETSSFSGSFHFDIELTDKGVQEWKTVTQHFFAYINMMKKEGYKRYLYEEQKTMREINYVYKDAKEGGYVTSNYAMKMQTYKDPLSMQKNHSLLHEYSAKDYDHFLSFISPEKVNLFLTTKGLETDTEEKFYGVRYKEEKLDIDFISSLNNATLNAQMHLPKENPFIPEHLEILTDKNSKPEKIFDNEWGSFWFQVDNEFHMPKASIKLVLLSDKTNSSPKNKVLAQLYTHAVNESLNEWAYDLSSAGLHLDISQSYKGIILHVSGYAEKIPNVFDKISSKLTEISISEQSFENIKADLKRDIANTLHNPTYWQTVDELRYARDKNMHHSFDLYDPRSKEGIDLISPSKLQDVKDYAKTLFADLALEGAGYGSLDPKELAKALERFTKAYGSKVLAKNKRARESIVEVPKGSQLSIVKTTETNNNAWGSVVQFGSRDHKLNAALRVGHSHLQTSFYSDLRTRQQLGYVVTSNLSFKEHVLGLFFLVQSANFSPFEISKRANTWTTGAIKELKTLSPEEFQTYKDSVVRELREKDKTIDEKLGTLYFESIIMNGSFNYKEAIAQATMSLTKEEMVQIFEKALLSKEKASMSVFYSTEKAQEKSVPGTLIPDVKAFKKRASVY